MNYYAELGVSRDASEREIRQAYRILVRLLHPDTQTGDDLRLAAERQLSRLNAMLAILTNVDSRHAYDLSLEQGLGRRQPRVQPQQMAHRGELQVSGSAVAGRASLVAQFALKYWAMILIGLVVFGAVALSALLQGTNEKAEEPQAAGAQGPSLPPVAKKMAREPRLQPRRPIADEEERPAAALVAHTRRPPKLDINASFVGSPAATLVAAPSSLGAIPVPTQAQDKSELITTPNETAAQSPEQAHPSPALTPTFSLSGNWLYTANLAAAQESGGYRALYVELLLSDKDGALSGNYRARYVVPDKAISPMVSFQVQGRASPDRGARLSWSAPNGVRGEAELSLSATGIMDFRWWSTESGGQSGLSSGSAKLIRQRTP